MDNDDDNNVTLNLKTRRDIYQYITKHPGMHLRAIARALRISLGDLRYHLDYLEKKGLISSRTDAYRKTYFSATQICYSDRDILALLRQKIPRTIILFLLTRPYAYFEDIRQELNRSKSTVSFHLKKLTNCKIIDVKLEENKKVYSVSDKNHIVNLLITYRSSFLDNAIDRVVDMWLE